MKLANTAIDRPVATLVLMLTAVVVGVYGFLQLPVDLLPDITYPMIKINILWPGATPEDIEQGIADLVERKLATVDDLDYLDSQSREGMYQLLVNFAYGVDVDIAYQDVTAKMGTIRGKLPDDAEAPIIIKADPSQLSVVDLAVYSKERDLVELRTWVDNYLLDQLTSVEGTAGAEAVGGLEREIRVHVDPRALEARGLSLTQVSRALTTNNVERLGGWVTGKRKEYVARTLAEFDSLDDLRSVVLAQDARGQSVFLSDVAEVVDSHARQRIVTAVDGQECIKVSVFKQTAANTVEVAEAIKRKAAELQALLPAGTQMAVVFDASKYIRNAVAGVRDATLLAAVLVVLVVAFFLTGWQRILVVVLTLPLTLLASAYVASLMGFSLNLFSLAGIVVAITVLLDNCVVVLENISRLQTEHPEEPHPIRIGVTQVGGAVLGATLTFVALFLPFLMVPGLSSLLFRELIVLVAVVLLFSLLMAVTVTPCLMNLFFPEGTAAAERRGPVAELSHRLVAAAQAAYRPVLAFGLRHPWSIVTTAVVLLGVGVLSLRAVGTEFLPRVDDGYVMIKLKMPTGTAVAETDRVLRRLEEAAAKMPYVKQRFRLSGGKIWGLVTYEIPQEGELDIELVPPSERPLNTDEWVAKYGPQIVKGGMVPGARIKPMHMKMRGIRKLGEFDVEVELRAPRTESIESMAATANQVKGILKDLPVLSKLDVSLDVTKPEYQVMLDRRRAGDLGVTADDVARAVRTYVDGALPTQYHEKGYYYDIRVTMPDGALADRDALRQLPVRTPTGDSVSLASIARVVPSVGPTEIDRYDQMRMIKVTADALGVSAGEANAAVARALADFKPPPGYTMDLGATAREMQQSFRSLGLVLALALFFAYVILAIQFESFTLPFVIMIRVPLSLIGVSLALFLTGFPLGATVMIGIVILAGIEINHGLVLLGYVRQLEEQGTPLREAITEGAQTRLRPVVMTLLVGIVGLLPLALGVGEGTELLQPMAIAVIGGLVFSLFLTFLFMPAAYLLFNRGKERTA